jgi:hypothetical protein
MLFSNAYLEQRKKYLSACADVLSLEKLATIDNRSTKEKEELKKTLAHIKFAAMLDVENRERGPIFLMGKINPEPEAKVLYASIALFLLGEKNELHTLIDYLYRKKEDFTKFRLIAYHVLKLAFADFGIFSKNAFATRQEIERLTSWLDENNVHLLWNEELLSYECPNKANN